MMQGQTGERWKQLCAQAADEKNPDRFLELIKEINDLLEAKRARVFGKKVDAQEGNQSGR